MSTLRVSNIEAKADVSSPSVHEKIKVTNSEGDVLVHIDGATSGISTVGINTTVKTFDVDSNQNIDFVGNLTAPNITVTGTLSYDDVTSIDSVGVITARNGLNVTSGSVGIGTDNPFRILHVSSNNDQYIRVTSTTSGNAGIEFGDAADPGRSNIVYANSDDSMFFTVNGSERLRITSAGLVGVNCNPLSQFQVKTGTNQNIAFSSMSSEASIEAFNDAGSANVPLRIRGTDIKFFSSSTERLRISSNGTTTVGPQYDQVKIEPGNGTYDGEATTLSVDGRTNDGNRVALKVDRYDSGTTATTRFSVKYDGTIFSTSGMQAASVNLQSSSTNSWFQTGASYGGTDYVWAAKNSSSNVWHSGLQTDGDLWLGGDITGTSNIKLDGSSGNATFRGKINVGSSYSGGEIFALGKSSGTSYLAYYDGGTAHGFIGHANQLVSGGAATDFAIRATNNLVFATNGNNERLRITSGGQLLLGTLNSTGTQLLKINGDTGGTTYGGHIALTQGRTSPGNGATHGVLSFGTETRPEVVKVVSFVDGTWTDGQYHPSGLYIATTDYNRNSPTEKIRITDIGEVNCYSTGSVIQAGTLQGGGYNAYFYEGRRNQNTGGTRTYIVWSNGNVQNTNNSYGSLSDQRLKENIVDATSQWDDIKSLQIRKYNFREATGNETHTQIGLIAQEAESVSPGLVQTTAVSEGEVLQDADGNQIESVKSINYSVLYMKAVKALQEAQTRIETLETQLTDALARITALEG